MRKPSAETQLREVKRLLSFAQKRVNELERDLGIYRGRATKAENEVAEWKARFDILLGEKATKP